jgi:hypothetical protein
MAYTYLQASSVARNPLARGLLLGVATTNELISLLDWDEVNGTSHDFGREGALASTEFVALDATSITESSSRGDQASTPLRLISSDLDIYNYTTSLTSPNGDPVAWQLSQKLKSAGLMLQGKMITGSNVTGFTVSESATSPGLAVDACVPSAGIDTTLQGPGSLRYTHTGTFWAFRAPGDISYGDNVAIAADGSATLYSYNRSKWVTVTIDVSDATADGEVHVRFTSSNNEPDGLAKLIPTSQTVTSSGANGDALSFDVLDQLILEKVKVRDNLVFCMNAALKRKFLALARTASGGLEPGHIAMPVLGMDGKVGMKNVPAYNGIPILQVDDIPSTEAKGGATTLSSVYLMSLAPKVGFHGVVGAGGSFQDIALDPYRARVAGFRLYDIGQRESKPARGIRVEWYGAFGLGSTLAAARASQLVTA